jgi:signal transduction histidine kinase
MHTLESHNQSEFLSRVSHELRTPLTSILGYAEVMLTDAKLSAESRHHYAEIILHEGWRLSHIIDNCIDIAFSDQRLALTVNEPLDVSSTVAEILETHRSTMETRSVEWELIAPETPLRTSANPARMRQLLHNFILNTVRMASEGGRIEVEMIPYDHGYEIEIRNRSKILNTDGTDAIRNAFVWQHAPNVELREPGVGFAFAKHLLELEGGSLTIEDHPTQGVSFLLRFSNI